jgi:HJR/Mrr/RecB family endonuclease
MSFEFKPEPNPLFVGRENEFRWLDDRLLRRHHNFEPIIIMGQGGIGKTALVSQWLATRRLSHDPVYVNLNHDLRENIIDEIILQLREPSERHLTDRGKIIVLDDAERWTDKQMEDALSRLYNWKVVSTIVVITRRRPELRRAEYLPLGPLSEQAAGAIIRRSAAALSEVLLHLAIDTAQGSPYVLELLGHMLNEDRPENVLASLRQGNLYDLPKTILLPKKEIISLSKPIIISAENRLIEGLKKQPAALRNLAPREFEVLLADLLRDMGWDVELTKATRDGGADILAYLNTDVGRLLCLVEAKHYREDRKVGVDLVRTLYGTLNDARASSAMLVTSSSFTGGAHEFQRKHQYQLSLREYADVVNWIFKFDQKK